MNPTVSTILLVALSSVALFGLVVVRAAPAGVEAEESSASGELGPAMDESFAVDPEFQALTGDDRSGADEAESSAPSAEEATLEGADSNIKDAKVQLSGADMTAAAGHHYEGHGHGVSGKLEMGAHTEKKGAFGWHAKFPVGGKSGH